MPSSPAQYLFKIYKITSFNLFLLSNSNLSAFLDKTLLSMKVILSMLRLSFNWNMKLLIKWGSSKLNDVLLFNN